MSIIVLKLPEVKVVAERPSQCPVCKGDILQRWGGQVKRLRDPYVAEALVYRSIGAAAADTPFGITREGWIRPSKPNG